MTSFRARPSGKRARTWDDRDRRSMLLNIGFGVTIVAALLLLLVAFGASWYGDHLAPAGDRSTARRSRRTSATASSRSTPSATDYQQRRIRTLLTAGRIRADDAQARQPVLDQRSQQARRDLARAADRRHGSWTQLAAAAGRDRHRRRHRRPAHRGGDDPGAPPRVDDRGRARARRGRDRARPTRRSAAAKAKADQALADLKAGKDWETVAKAVSTDATKEQGGDLGFIDENAALDADVRRRAVGRRRGHAHRGHRGRRRRSSAIGRVTEIVAPVVDATLAGAGPGATGIELEPTSATALRRDVTRDQAGRRGPRHVPRARPAARGRRDLHAARARASPARGRDQGPPHPVLAQRRPAGRGRASAETDPAWAEAEAEGRRAPTRSSRPTRACSTRSRARRATRARR